MSLTLKRGGVPVKGTSKTVEGLHFRLVVWVRTGSRDWRNRWHRLAKALGVQWSLVPANPEGGPATYHDEQGNEVAPPPDHGHEMYDGKACWESAYDAWGLPEALEALTSEANRVVVRWEYARTPAREPLSRVGRATRPKSSKPKPKPSNNHAFDSLDKLLKPYTVKGYKLPGSEGPEGFVSR